MQLIIEHVILIVRFILLKELTTIAVIVAIVKLYSGKEPFLIIVLKAFAVKKSVSRMLMGFNAEHSYLMHLD